MNEWVIDAGQAAVANGPSAAAGQSRAALLHDSPIDVVPQNAAFRRQWPAPAAIAGYCQGDSEALRSVNQCVAVVAVFVFSALGIFFTARVCFARQPKASTAHRIIRLDHARGKQAFDSRCATCHGLDGRGGEHAPGIVNSPAAAALTDERLANIIRHGIPDAGMPSFHFLTNQQTEEIIRYIRVLPGSSRAANLKGNPAVGAKLFFGSARCSDCHMMHGKGGFIGSDLSKFGRTHTAGEIRQVILQPDKTLVPRWQLVKIVTRSGQHFSGLVRNEDNFSIALLSRNGVFHLLMKSDIRKITREPRSIMPDDYGKRLNAKQLDDLVSYLILGSAHKSSEENTAGKSSSK